MHRHGGVFLYRGDATLSAVECKKLSGYSLLAVMSWYAHVHAAYFFGGDSMKQAELSRPLTYRKPYPGSVTLKITPIHFNLYKKPCPLVQI